MNNKNQGYCKCKECSQITSGYEDDWGYWDVCAKCGKRIEGMDITTIIIATEKTMKILIYGSN